MCRGRKRERRVRGAGGEGGGIVPSYLFSPQHLISAMEKTPGFLLHVKWFISISNCTDVTQVITDKS